MSPTSIRGALGSLNQLLICVGILAALIVNVVYPPTAWRTLFMWAAVPAALLGLGKDVPASVPHCLPVAAYLHE